MRSGFRAVKTLAIAIAIVVASCASSPRGGPIIPAALEARYDADEAVVREAVRAAATARYGSVSEDKGALRTDWEWVEVWYPVDGSQNKISDRFYFQLAASVVGPRPFRVDVAATVKLDNRPLNRDPEGWLSERIQQLRSAIYLRLQQLAAPAPP